MESNPLLQKWADGFVEQVIGALLVDVFPELMGMESMFSQISDAEPLRIPKIHRPGPPPSYLDLQLERYADLTRPAEFLLTITDVTQQSLQEQYLQQQHNELQLLSGQLQQANEQ